MISMQKLYRTIYYFGYNKPVLKMVNESDNVEIEINTDKANENNKIDIEATKNKSNNDTRVEIETYEYKVNENDIFFALIKIPFEINEIIINKVSYSLHLSTFKYISELENGQQWINLDSNDENYVKSILNLLSIPQVKEYIQFQPPTEPYAHDFIELILTFNFNTIKDYISLSNKWINYFITLIEDAKTDDDVTMDAFIQAKPDIPFRFKLFTKIAIERFLVKIRDIGYFGQYTSVLYLYNEVVCSNYQDFRANLFYYPLSIPINPKNSKIVDPINIKPIQDLLFQGYTKILLYSYINEYHSVFMNLIDRFPESELFTTEIDDLVAHLKKRLENIIYSEEYLVGYFTLFVKYIPDYFLGLTDEIEQKLSNSLNISVEFIRKLGADTTNEEEDHTEIFKDAEYPISEYYRQNVGFTYHTPLKFNVDQNIPDFE